MYQITRKDVADTIEAFINGKGGERDWDDFISLPLSDPELDKVRVRCAQLPEEFPPDGAGRYCNEKGFQVLRNFLEFLRSK